MVKKIAVLLGQAEEAYQSGFMKGLMERAFEQGFDVYAFSMYIKYQNTKEREVGDSNIYNLINYDLFDAVIIMSDVIQTPGVEKEIEEKIHKVFKGPVICVDTTSEYYNSFWTDGYYSVYKLISHLIEEHGYKDIAYLTGRKNHVHSQRRLEAYRDAMKDHGINVKDDMIFYGDFWYTSGAGCAKSLLRDKHNLPEAMACANDCMAIGFADEMIKNGIRIPEDIAVVGYGSTEEGQTCPKSLTSTYIPAEYYGGYAVDSVIRLLKGEEIQTPKNDVELYIGETCGCGGTEYTTEKVRRNVWTTDASDDGFYSIHNYMFEDMLGCDKLEDFLEVIYDNMHHLKDIESFRLCLNEEWAGHGKIYDKDYSNNGYSENMLNALTYYSDSSRGGKISTEDIFERKKLISGIEGSDKPTGYFFTPLYYENNSFGYAILSYGNKPCSYDETYRVWINSVRMGLECMRRSFILKSVEDTRLRLEAAKFSQMYEKTFTHDKNAALFQEELAELKEVEKILDNNQFVYHFQPIVNAINGEIYSYEALMRSGTDKKIPPLAILKYAERLDRLDDVEKATFINVLDIVKNNKEAFDERKVFLNSIPGINLEDDDYSQIENMVNSLNDKIVVELTEQSELEDEELVFLKKEFERLELQLAVDDYGTGYSNVTNLLRYMPDYVKIDRSLIMGIDSNNQKQHFVREAVEFCHDNGIMALAEGVETVEELATVIKLGVDLIQGFYIARPNAEIVDNVDSNVKMEISRYHREKIDGNNDQIFVAGKSSRITLGNLMKAGKNVITIGEKNVPYRDITIVGTPGIKSDIHIEIYEGYDGSVTFENVSLSNKKGRPCIRMANDTSLVLNLIGDNMLDGGGIKIPESSKLVIEGDGNLSVNVAGSENYGIGNDLSSRHGALDFYQDGEINIRVNGKTGIGIGSGLGGLIKINKGKFVISVNADEAVALGSMKGSDKIVIHDCDMTIEGMVSQGVLIGNYSGDVDVEIWRTLLNATGGARKMAVVGTVEGEHAVISMHAMGANINYRGDNITALGSYQGSTKFKIESSNIKCLGIGSSAYVVGGISKDVMLDLSNVDIIFDLETERGTITNGVNVSGKRQYIRSTVKLNGKDLVL